jgi:hypothetical protein
VRSKVLERKSESHYNFDYASDLKGIFAPKNEPPSQRVCQGKIGTRFLHPRSTSPLKGVNSAGTPGYRNGTESFFGLKGSPSVVRDVYIHNQPVLRMRSK